MACHFPVVSVVPVVSVRPLENEIPCGRPANFQRHSLRAARQFPVAFPAAFLVVFPRDNFETILRQF
jgi:hypothetical protein